MPRLIRYGKSSVNTNNNHHTDSDSDDNYSDDFIIIRSSSKRQRNKLSHHVTPEFTDSFDFPSSPVQLINNINNNNTRSNINDDNDTNNDNNNDSSINNVESTHEHELVEVSKKRKRKVLLTETEKEFILNRAPLEKYKDIKKQLTRDIPLSTIKKVVSYHKKKSSTQPTDAKRGR